MGGGGGTCSRHVRRELLHALFKQQLNSWRLVPGLWKGRNHWSPLKRLWDLRLARDSRRSDVRLIAILCQPNPSYFCVLLPASAVFRWTSFVTLHCRSVGDVSGPGTEVGAAQSVLPRPPYTSGWWCLNCNWTTSRLILQRFWRWSYGLWPLRAVGCGPAVLTAAAFRVDTAKIMSSRPTRFLQAQPFGQNPRLHGTCLQWMLLMLLLLLMMMTMKRQGQRWHWWRRYLLPCGHCKDYELFANTPHVSNPCSGKTFTFMAYAFSGLLLLIK